MTFYKSNMTNNKSKILNMTHYKSNMTFCKSNMTYNKSKIFNMTMFEFCHFYGIMY